MKKMTTLRILLDSRKTHNIILEVIEEENGLRRNVDVEKIGWEDEISPNTQVLFFLGRQYLGAIFQIYSTTFQEWRKWKDDVGNPYKGGRKFRLVREVEDIKDWQFMEVRLPGRA